MAQTASEIRNIDFICESYGDSSVLRDMEVSRQETNDLQLLHIFNAVRDNLVNVFSVSQKSQGIA